MGLLLSVADSAAAAIVAPLRRGLGSTLDPVFPLLPLGTPTAIVAGGTLMGVAVALLVRHADAAPETRLAITTGTGPWLARLQLGGAPT